MLQTPTVWQGSTAISSGSSVLAIDSGYVIAGISDSGYLSGSIYYFGGTSYHFGEPLEAGATRPRLTQLESGDISIAYQYPYSSTDWDIRAIDFSSVGTSRGPSYVIEASSNSTFLLEYDAGARGSSSLSAIVYQDLADKNYYFRENAGGQIALEQIAPVYFGAPRPVTSGTYLDNGDFVAVWTNALGSNNSVLIGFSNSGVNIPAFWPMEVERTTLAAFPTVTELSNGHLIVAWQDVADQRMYYKIVDDQGNRVSETRFVSDPFGISPEVAPLSGGGFAMAWTSYVGTESDGSPDGDVAVLVFDSAGNTVGNVRRIDKPGDQTLSDITILEDDRIVVV